MPANARGGIETAEAFTDIFANFAASISVARHFGGTSANCRKHRQHYVQYDANRVVAEGLSAATIHANRSHLQCGGVSNRGDNVHHRCAADPKELERS